MYDEVASVMGRWPPVGWVPPPLGGSKLQSCF